MNIKGANYYGSGDSVNGAFQVDSHENLSITTTASTSSNLDTELVFLSLLVGAHVKVGSGDATTSDPVYPAGIWPIIIDNESTLSVIKVTGSDDGQASVIIPKK